MAKAARSLRAGEVGHRLGIAWSSEAARSTANRAARRVATSTDPRRGSLVVSDHPHERAGSVREPGEQVVQGSLKIRHSAVSAQCARQMIETSLKPVLPFSDALP